MAMTLQQVRGAASLPRASVRRRRRMDGGCSFVVVGQQLCRTLRSRWRLVRGLGKNERHVFMWEAAGGGRDSSSLETPPTYEDLNGHDINTDRDEKLFTH